MNFWQFKFNIQKGNWKEFETISSGEEFYQEITAYKRMEGSEGDIVFYYQTDKKYQVGIHFITEIISAPHKDESSTGYVIKLKVLRRLKQPFNDTNFLIYNRLQSKLKPMGQGASKYLLKEEDEGKKLFDFLMKGNVYNDIIQIDINSKIINDFNNIREEHIQQGFLFNPFHNLNLIRGEVKHLSFLGNLLNPMGNHFKGNVFLKHFINSLLGYIDLKDNKFLQKFTDKNPLIEIEKQILLNNGDKARIDLWLENDEYIIAIEGKIEAKDSLGQLDKYNDYLNKSKKEFILLYLTLKKNEEPKNLNNSDLKESKKFHLINFEEDIIDFIDDSIEDNTITDNIQNTLIDYKDALLKYMYDYHLSFEYSLSLIDFITKSEFNFLESEKIKDIFFQNKNKYKNTVIEDIAQCFEYAKAYIERLFYVNLRDKAFKNDYMLKDDSEVSLREDKTSIAKDLYKILKVRESRLQPKILHNSLIEFPFDLDGDFFFSIRSDYLGVFKNEIHINIDTLSLLEYGANKIEPDIFKSSYIINLLNKKYRESLILNFLESN